ncbi:MAG: TraR/DksA C4-type zinc finger protein, partial [Actinomycetota bacterium]|nr:TraR/DksA C4-type zinc finger protein [Actinomycetota bacterium]
MDKKTARELLRTQRARLEEVLEGLDADRSESQAESISELSTEDQHPGDIGTETFEREKDYSIRQAVEAEISEVDHALERVKDGTYGVCVACGGQIGEARLKARPATRHCVEDQARV